MLRIGEFSRLSQVTVKTLHHYDDIDLLTPAHIDPFTKHRYYEAEQFLQVNRIMALKDLGFSLEQIKRMLSEDLDTAELRGMLRLKQAENQQLLQDAQSKLSNVEFRLRMLEMEDGISDIDVVFKQVPALDALTFRTSIERKRLVGLGIAFEKAQATHNIRLSGPVGEIRYEQAFEPTFLDVEFFWPVMTNHAEKIELEGFGFLTYSTVPGIQAASFVLKGADRPPLDEALILLQRWLVANEYTLGGTNRAIYHHGPTEHAEYKDWIIEIQHAITTIPE